jgi:hypothetical protein
MPPHTNSNLSVCSPEFVNCLNSIDDHLNNRGVNRGIRPDIFDGSSDIDIAHCKNAIILVNGICAWVTQLSSGSISVFRVWDSTIFALSAAAQS